jgi:hypothetical protein
MSLNDTKPNRNEVRISFTIKYKKLKSLKIRVVNQVGLFLMKKKLNFKSKIILIKKIENIFGKAENFFSKIIKNILFENKKF